MDESTDQSARRPERSWATFFAAFFASLNAEFGVTFPDDLEATIRARQARLELERERWVSHPQDSQHFALTSIVLAAYEVLRPAFGRTAAVDALRRAFTAMWGQWIRRGTAAELDAAPDAFVAMTTLARAKEATTYGPSFTFERERDDADALWTKISRCYYYDYFKSHDATELTPIFCDWDTNWSSAIDVTRHRFRFERPTTIGGGDDACRFRFTRER